MPKILEILHLQENDRDEKHDFSLPAIAVSTYRGQKNKNLALKLLFLTYVFRFLPANPLSLDHWAFLFSADLLGDRIALSPGNNLLARQGLGRADLK